MYSYVLYWLYWTEKKRWCLNGTMISANNNGLVQLVYMFDEQVTDNHDSITVTIRIEMKSSYMLEMNPFLERLVE